jgi:MFS transporter, SP family, sugar:H+ symporter
MVDGDKGNLGARVFFIWGSLCALCFIYAYFLIYETKGLTLEQVDKMMEESTPISSTSWRATTTFAAEMGLTEKGTVAPIAVHEENKEV